MRSVLDIIFPQRCNRCGRELKEQGEQIICWSCWEAAECLEPPFCDTCGRPFLSSCPGIRTCGTCFTGRIHYDRARACFIYRGESVVSDLLLAFKYGNRHSLGRRLGERLYRRFEDYFGDRRIDVMVPVPLHPWRRFQRGYNQAALLARHLGNRTGHTVMSGVLFRRRWTQPQSGPASARSRNVSSVFKVFRPGRLSGRNVLLIDDVFTTGATVNECARVLRRNGSGRIYVYTVARVCGM